MSIKNIVITLLSTLSGVSFGIAVSTFMLTNGFLNSQYNAFVVQSGSMEPSIKVGSFIFTKTASEYNVGEIITFTVNNNTVTHRVSSIVNEDGLPVYKTKGDANEEIDSWNIKADQIVGKSQLTIPYLGYISNFVRTPKGFVALVIIPASIIIYEEFKNILREIKKFLSILSFSRKRESSDNDSGSPIKSGMTKLAIPVLGVALLLIGGSLSYFYDHEDSQANVMEAGEWNTPLPSPTPSP